MDGEVTERAMRPEVLDGFTRRIRVGCGNLYITITSLPDGTPFECFATLGKAGGCPSAAVEAVARLVSDLLRCGVEVDVPLQTLVGISCERAQPGDGPLSCFDAIARTLLDIHDKQKAETETQHDPRSRGYKARPDGDTAKDTD